MRGGAVGWRGSDGEPPQAHSGRRAIVVSRAKASAKRPAKAKVGEFASEPSRQWR